MVDRYVVLPNVNPHTNGAYPWLVADTEHGNDAIALSVTKHTALSWCSQLNENGYIADV